MFRHVLCVYPYRVEHGPRHRFYPPLGIEIIAAALKPHATEIDVVDLRRETRHTVDFLRSDTDLVCFSVNWDMEYDFVREEISSVSPAVLTVVGGRHATEDPEKWLCSCPNIDALVRGDGEEAITEIAGRWRGAHASSARPRRLDMRGIAGVSYRIEGNVVHGPVRHLRPISDSFQPDRRFRRYSYHMHIDGFRGVAFDAAVTSRGCPFNCKFCSFNRNPWGGKRPWSTRSPESVVAEIEQIDAGFILFVDDNFTHDMDRVEAICDLLLARGIRKRYGANARVEIAKRPDVIRKMERAGFSMLALGIESAQDKTLRSLRKGFSTRQLREYFRVLQRSRMLLHGYFIVGSIGETEEEMLEIAPFARELGIDTIMLCSLRNERYSAIEELVARHPGYHIDPDGIISSDLCPRERTIHIRKSIRRSFYTAGGLLRTLTKALRNRLLTAWMLVRLPGFLLKRAVRRCWRRFR